jgi:hypothetical protein
LPKYDHNDDEQQDHGASRCVDGREAEHSNLRLDGNAGAAATVNVVERWPVRGLARRWRARRIVGDYEGVRHRARKKQCATTTQERLAPTPRNSQLTGKLRLRSTRATREAPRCKTRWQCVMILPLDVHHRHQPANPRDSHALVFWLPVGTDYY